MKSLLGIILFLCLFSLNAFALEPAINIVTYHPLGFRVDDTEQGQRVRRLLEKIQQLGVKVLILNVRGHMITGRGSEINSVIPESLRPEEEFHIRALAAYAKQKGMEVAFRPILLVVGPKGEFPYTEKGVTWWHGNIEPKDPVSWFNNYFKFHERYMMLAASVGAKWYSVGAEMHSMTSGLGSRKPKWRFGFPDKWVTFVNAAKERMHSHGVAVTYGANFTDQFVLENAKRTWGGELEQWRHDITFKPKSSKENLHQNNMRELWRSLDFLGLDFYRSLGKKTSKYPEAFEDLANHLTVQTRGFAQQIQKSVEQIAQATGVSKEVGLQEVGYRSVEKCFVSPYHYEGGTEPINYMHQAAAWEALLRASAEFGLYGVGIWQVLVDEDTDLLENRGFSPLGKQPVSEVFRRHFIVQ